MLFIILTIVVERFYFFLKAISKREFNGKVLASSLLATNRVKGKAAVKIYDQEEFSHY